MKERGVTVVTWTVNFDGPFNSFVASRGLVSMHLSVASRLPFFDGSTCSVAGSLTSCLSLHCLMCTGCYDREGCFGWITFFFFLPWGRR